MASSAQAQRSAEVALPYDPRIEAQARPRQAAQARRQAHLDRRLVRALAVFVVCLSLLAIGRVAMSFAVVQKSVATDAIVREERLITAENAQLTEELAHLGSSVRIREIAEKDLGMVEATHVKYIKVAKDVGAKADSRP
ncbi:MAG: cell division protein FtsL [Thermoleophilia bacterium]